MDTKQKIILLSGDGVARRKEFKGRELGPKRERERREKDMERHHSQQ